MRPSLQRPLPPRRAEAGYTLIELMVIVTIIMTIMALAGPGMMRAIQSSRASQATMDLARVGRAARDGAITSGVAHLLACTNDGQCALWRGLTDSCASNPWATITAGGCTVISGDCLGGFDIAQYSMNGSEMTVTFDGDARTFCFEPDDVMYTSTALAGFSIPNAAEQVNIVRDSGDLSAVETRTVLFSAYLPPRVQR